MIARDGYDRLILWLSNQGYVCDLGVGDALVTRAPDSSESPFRAADGTSRSLARNAMFEVRILRSTLRDHVRRIRNIGCRARLVGLSPGGAHQVWYEPTSLQFTDHRAGIFAFAGGRLRLENRVFEPAIWQSSNILEGLPWHCAVAVADGGSFFFEFVPLAGYEGPKWEVASGDVVSCVGVPTLSGSAVAEMEFPCGGATVLLTGCTGTIEALSWGNAVISSAANDVAFVLPEGTWKIRVTVTAAPAQPRLEIVKSGRALGPRFGGFQADCATAVSTPPWYQMRLPVFVTAQSFFAPSLTFAESILLPEFQTGQAFFLPVYESLSAGESLLIVPVLTTGQSFFPPTYSELNITADHVWAADQITGLANNDPVVTWPDTGAGTPRDGAASGPIYRTNQQNGLPGVDFDGVDDFVNLGDQLATESEEYTLFAVFRPDVADARRMVISTGDTSGNGRAMKLAIEQGDLGENVSDPFNKVSYTFGGDTALADTSYGYTETSVLRIGYASVVAIRRDTPNTEDDVWWNDTLRATIPVATGADNAHVNAWLTVLGRLGEVAPGFHFDGCIFEVQIFNRVLSDQEVSDVNQYLIDKWGVEFPPILAPVLTTGQSFFAPIFTAGSEGGPDSDHIWAADEIIGLANNDPVVTWPDTGTGTPRDGTGNGPVYKTNQQNGLPAVEFDGSNDWVDLGTDLAAEAAEYTVFAVFKPAAAAQRGCVIANLHTSGANADSKLWIEQGTVGESASNPYNKIGYSFGNGVGSYSWGYTSNDVIAAATPVVVTVRRVTGQSYEEIYVNGVLEGVVQSQSLATAAHTSAYQTALGRMGAWALAPFHGLIMEVRINNSALVTADREAIEDHLMTKWGI